MHTRKTRFPLFTAILALAVTILIPWGPFMEARAQEADHVILIIGDGMQLEHERAGSLYLYGVDDGLSFHQFPYQTASTTWDINTYNRYAWWANQPAFDPSRFNPLVGYNPAQGGDIPYPATDDSTDAYFLTPLFSFGALSGRGIPATDSGAAGTALATGQKTTSGRISWKADGEPGGAIKTIAEQVRAQRGGAIGVVSSVPFSHATPAAFVSHNASRGNTYTGKGGYDGLGIADEIITKVQPDVVIGGGHPQWENPEFDMGRGYISEAMYATLGASDVYVLAERQEGQDGGAALRAAADRAIAEGRKLFGLFGGPGGNFDPPEPQHAPDAPRVEAATDENPTLPQAAVEALRVLSQNENGLFLMVEQGDIDWANHANHYEWMVGTIYDIDETVKAVVDFVEQPDNALDWSNTLVIVTSDHGNSYLRLADEARLGRGVLPRQEEATDEQRQSGAGPFVYPDGEVTYATTGHTNELVSVYAIGDAADQLQALEGTWYPDTRIIDNTQIYQAIATAMGLRTAPTAVGATR